MHKPLIHPAHTNEMTAIKIKLPTLQYQAVKDYMDYAKFTSESDLISQALNHLFKKDKEFQILQKQARK